MRLPANSLQSWIYETLTTNTNTKVYSTWDAVPQDASPPYIVIGEVLWENSSTKTTEGTKALATIHIWSKYEGMREVNEIMSAVLDALSVKEPISLDGGYTLLGCFLDMAHTLRDIEGRHGVLRLRLYIEVET